MGGLREERFGGSGRGVEMRARDREEWRWVGEGATVKRD